MNELDGAQLQLEMGERVILIAAIIDAALPGLVRKAGVGQRTQREQGAHEKLCQPKAKAHLKTFRTSIPQRSQFISNRGRRCGPPTPITPCRTPSPTASAASSVPPEREARVRLKLPAPGYSLVERQSLRSSNGELALVEVVRHQRRDGDDRAGHFQLVKS